MEVSKKSQKNDYVQTAQEIGYVFLLRNCTMFYFWVTRGEIFQTVLNTFKGHHHPQDPCFSTPLLSHVSGIKNECFMDVLKYGGDVSVAYVHLVLFWVTRSKF